MKIDHEGFLKRIAKLTKTLLLWLMFISGLVLATRQAKACELNEPNAAHLQANLTLY